MEESAQNFQSDSSFPLSYHWSWCGGRRKRRFLNGSSASSTFNIAPLSLLLIVMLQLLLLLVPMLATILLSSNESNGYLMNPLLILSSGPFTVALREQPTNSGPSRLRYGWKGTERGALRSQQGHK